VSDDLLLRPVDELAGLVRSGEVTARELTELSLAAIEARDPHVNAFVDVLADEALAAADAVAPGDERPLAGVPVAIKNNRAVAGARLTNASELFGDFVAPHDHNVTARLRAAGAIVVGTTTLPELGILPATNTRRFGAARNPWDLARTPGGSSGGSAAAVAAGMVPFAHANDGGGSTRIPAACTGLVGLKPQRGRISLAPELGHQLLVQDGVLTRTVRETALCLDVLAGYVEGDLAWAPPPARPFAEQAAQDPGRLRIAATTFSPLEEAPVDAEGERAVQEAAALLEELGHEVVWEDPPWRNPAFEGLFAAVFGPAVCTSILWGAMVSGQEPTQERMEPLTWELWQQTKQLDSVLGLGAEYQLQGLARAIVVWTAQFDAVLTPALATQPPPVEHLDPELGMEAFGRAGRFTPFTPVFNVTGQPAISLPLTTRDDGFPLAVQLAGRPAGEGELLALAAQLEAARPWADRVAPVPA
jgi:amidase